MTALPLGKGAYDRTPGPRVPLVNMLFEADPRNQRDQVSLIQRPGMSLYATCGAGPIRGMYRQQGVVSSATFVVSGDELYKIVGSTVTQITGTIAGTGYVSMAGNATTVYIASGTTLYSTNGTTLSTVAFPDSADCTSVSYINGYFLFVRGGSHRFYWLVPGSTSIDGLDYLSAESTPDDLEGVTVLGDQVFLMGKTSVEVADPTGDTEIPFLRVGGRIFHHGCIARATLCDLVGSLVWVGIDRATGALAVFRMVDGPERISDNYIEERLRAATSLRAWTWGVDGHTFYCLTTGNETLAFDSSTQAWTNLKSYGLSYFRGHLGCSLGDGRVICGDAINGKVWLLDPALSEDDGGPMERVFAGRIQLDSAQRCDNLVLEVQAGDAGLAYPDDDPMIAMEFSDDGTRTWSEPEREPLGRQGEYDALVVWRRLGRTGRFGRDFRFKVTDNVRLTVRRAELNGSTR